ncbi:MAG: hypothetical protein IT258_11340 [Saprospiraceae bacterium]|nr:hypothetical protein [Saprospiraceae bacterium]
MEEIKEPDLAIISNFGIKIPTEIEYQFYQKYGFTDVVEQLIFVGKINQGIVAKSEESVELNELEFINSERFSQGKPVLFDWRMELQSDILIEGKYFDLGKNHEVDFGRGQTLVFKSAKSETIIVKDDVTELVYVESIKVQ